MDTKGRLTPVEIASETRGASVALISDRRPYRISDVPDEWGQDVRIVDVDGDPVLTVDTEHRSLTEAEEITRRVCAALNGTAQPVRGTPCVEVLADDLADLMEQRDRLIAALVQAETALAVQASYRDRD
ncbi:hypothetical protein WHK35_14185, partial [Staphylococcus aureus]|uniref:hypothetical protein n=1 Tax=Staphylococcus aureus TaxID=1280 RepID=UPI0039BE4B87